MKIYELFNKCSLEEVAKCLVKHYNATYRNEEKALQQLNDFINELDKLPVITFNEDDEYYNFYIFVGKSYEIHSSNSINLLKKYKDFNSLKEQSNTYYFVEGYYLRELLIKNIKPETYFLDFISRTIVKNCEVIDSCIDNFGINDVACHIFWEMTFYGLYEQDVEKELERINEIYEDFKEYQQIVKERYEDYKILEPDDFYDEEIKASIKINNILIEGASVENDKILKEFIKTKE